LRGLLISWPVGILDSEVSLSDRLRIVERQRAAVKRQSEVYPTAWADPECRRVREGLVPSAVIMGWQIDEFADESPKLVT
jgi:hypothetical protein